MAETLAQQLRLNSGLIQNLTAETFYEPVKRTKYAGLTINKELPIFNICRLALRKASGKPLPTT